MKVRNPSAVPVHTDDGLIPAGGVGDVNSRKPRNAQLLERGALRPVHRSPSPQPAPQPDRPEEDPS